MSVETTRLPIIAAEMVDLGNDLVYGRCFCPNCDREFLTVATEAENCIRLLYFMIKKHGTEGDC